MSRAQLEANIADSRDHIAKQEALIARLTRQGHVAMIVEASALLETMRVHLRSELDMLSQMGPA